MNRRMILHILGRILLMEAVLMLPSVLIGLIYAETETVSFILPIALLVLLGAYPAFRKPENTAIYAKDGFFIVAAAWILMSLAGALPLFLSGGFKTYVDAFFEIVSGFSTTGASVHSAPETLPHCILFWRSFSHWVGGMGVLVFVLAIVPLSEDRSLVLMRAESPGPIVGKLVPRMRDTAKILYSVYAALTAILFVLLVLGDMPVFDAICNSLATAGTGGFSIHSSGIALYDSAYIDIVMAIFMILFGVNFNLYYLLLTKRVKDALKCEEVRWYFIIVAIFTAAIAINIFSGIEAITGSAGLSLGAKIGESFRYSFFQVSSIITTSGFATFDYTTLAPAFTSHLLVFLMMIGACAGSTGGGLKISRLLILIKAVFQEVRRLIHPRAVTVVRLEGRVLDNALVRGVLTYFAAYVLIISFSTLLLSLIEPNVSFATNFTAELSCFNNIGPGLEAVGPMGGFGFYSPLAKILLSFNMLLGRLEIMPMLILFAPEVWRKKI